MLSIESTGLVLIDVQGKLAHMMPNKEALFKNLHIMINAAKILNLPIFWAEQLPHKLGATIPELSELLEGYQAISKSCFSCAKQPGLQEALSKSGCKQLLVMGMEAHICVTQSTLELLDAGYEVHLVSDAIAARNPENKSVALSRCTSAGAILSCSEMALFELMRDASHEKFKAVQQLIK